MARPKNDGKGRMGGRAKGTPNKVTSSMREWLSLILDKNKKQIEKDLKDLEPKDRLVMLEKFMQYVIPKQQSVSAEIDINNLSEEQLDMIIAELTQGVEDEEEDNENDKD